MSLLAARDNRAENYFRHGGKFVTTLKTWPPLRVDFMVSPSLPFQDLWDDHLDWDGKGQLVLYDGLCEVSRNVWRNSVGSRQPCHR